MAALAAVAKKVWSARRLLLLLLTPLALLPVVFALPPKVMPPLFVRPPSRLPGGATGRTLSSQASEAGGCRGPSLDRSYQMLLCPLPFNLRRLLRTPLFFPFPSVEPESHPAFCIASLLPERSLCTELYRRVWRCVAHFP